MELAIHNPQCVESSWFILGSQRQAGLPISKIEFAENSLAMQIKCAQMLAVRLKIHIFNACCRFGARLLRVRDAKPFRLRR